MVLVLLIFAFVLASIAAYLSRASTPYGLGWASLAFYYMSLIVHSLFPGLK